MSTCLTSVVAVGFIAEVFSLALSALPSSAAHTYAVGVETVDVISPAAAVLDRGTGVSVLTELPGVTDLAGALTVSFLPCGVPSIVAVSRVAVFFFVAANTRPTLVARTRAVGLEPHDGDRPRVAVLQVGACVSHTTVHTNPTLVTRANAGSSSTRRVSVVVAIAFVTQVLSLAFISRPTCMAAADAVRPEAGHAHRPAVAVLPVRAWILLATVSSCPTLVAYADAIALVPLSFTVGGTILVPRAYILVCAKSTSPSSQTIASTLRFETDDVSGMAIAI